MSRHGISILALLVAFANQGHANVEQLRQQPLPELDGKEVEMFTVSYGPGESSPPHRHNAHVFVYVLEGQLEMQVDGGEAVQLKPGDSFYETPDDVHRVSRNTSETEGAKFLVFMIKEEGAPTTESLRPGN